MLQQMPVFFALAHVPQRLRLWESYVASCLGLSITSALNQIFSFLKVLDRRLLEFVRESSRIRSQEVITKRHGEVLVVDVSISSETELAEKALEDVRPDLGDGNLPPVVLDTDVGSKLQKPPHCVLRPLLSGIVKCRVAKLVSLIDDPPHLLVG